MLNEALRKALSKYYWGEGYEGDIIRYTDADKRLELLMNNLKGCDYTAYEADLSNITCWYEYEGLLHGYIYCLTMVGMYKGGDEIA